MFVIELVNIKPETIYNTHLTIITTPPPFMSKYYFDTKIQAIFLDMIKDSKNSMKSLRSKGNTT